MSIKEQIEENIKRLEKTISLNCWNKGYAKNCELQLEAYRIQLSELNK